MNRHGPKISGDICTFSVWAPEKNDMFLHIVSPEDKLLKMEKNSQGYFSVSTNVQKDCKYFYNVEGKKDYPDPASGFQPDGVHGPSQVVDHDKFKWHDDSWKGIPLHDMVLYEIHTGTYTPEGTFQSIIHHLDELYYIGINAIELMPVSQFPGNRNWGYDGVYPYSVQNSYGGPEGLKLFIDACHRRGMAVILDTVYNHIGPEGNYFQQYGPYFSGKYKVVWGDAINFDDAWSDGVREYFTGNMLHWYKNYHLDGLRLDAIHAIFDSGAVHFWHLADSIISNAEQKHGRRFWMIAESDFNNPAVVKSAEAGGFGFDAQWLDDFHHALYVLLDQEGKSRYEDFGSMEQLAKAYTDGFVHSGEYVNFRKRRHGLSSAGIQGDKFVVFNQNHDQAGNRPLGERLSSLVSQEKLLLASAALFLSPYIPMLFMGEEYGEDNPFLYFVSHNDPDLVQAVREGRKLEFADYKWSTEPPDPVDEATFRKCVLNIEKRLIGKYRILYEWNRTLITLRKTNSALRNFNKNGLFAFICSNKGLILHRKSEDETEHVIAFLCFSDDMITFNVPSGVKKWTKILDSNEWREDMEANHLPAPGEILPGEIFKADAWSVVVYSNSHKS